MHACMYPHSLSSQSAIENSSPNHLPTPPGLKLESKNPPLDHKPSCTPGTNTIKYNVYVYINFTQFPSWRICRQLIITLTSISTKNKWHAIYSPSIMWQCLITRCGHNCLLIVYVCVCYILYIKVSRRF